MITKKKKQKKKQRSADHALKNNFILYRDAIELQKKL